MGQQEAALSKIDADNLKLFRIQALQLYIQGETVGAPNDAAHSLCVKARHAVYHAAHACELHPSIENSREAE